MTLCPYDFETLEDILIPESKKESVARALLETFGVSEFDDIQKLTQGLSAAKVFRIAVSGRSYLLRLVEEGTLAGPGQGDQSRHYHCMTKGAESGIAPRVLYVNAGDRICITDFVQARPLPRSEALARLPITLRALHALPPFPPLGPRSHLDIMDTMVRKFLDANLLPAKETSEVLHGFDRVAAAYPRSESDMVSSHNDLKPENILFDGVRVWLVDWEASFLNDRYLDLAVVANFVVTNEVEEEAFLRAYFGEAAGDYRRAQFFLMRQILHSAYAAMFLRLGSGSRPVENESSCPAVSRFP